MNQIVEKPKKYSLVERAPAASFEEERLHRKQRLAATFRLFSRYGFDQGLAGHVTVRDPEFPDRFWINPLSKFFGQIKVSDLQLVDHAKFAEEMDELEEEQVEVKKEHEL